MHVHPYAWFITIGIMTVILALDVLVLGRRPHEPSMKECGIFVGFFVGLAVLFGLGVSHISGPRYGKEFFAGWLTEYSLSLDNLFIFLIIMAKMKVPRKLQQYALLVGIILALIFRGIFIAMGAAIINRFAFVFFAFGAFLLYTAFDLVKDFFEKDADDEATDHREAREQQRDPDAFEDRFPGGEDIAELQAVFHRLPPRDDGATSPEPAI